MIAPHGTDEELGSERLSDLPPVTWVELAKDRAGIKSQVWLPQRLMFYMPGVNHWVAGHRVEFCDIPQHGNQGRNRRNKVPMKSHPASLGGCFEDTLVQLFIFSTLYSGLWCATLSLNSLQKLLSWVKSIRWINKREKRFLGCHKNYSGIQVIIGESRIWKMSSKLIFFVNVVLYKKL